jgi:hypothetical protein
MGKKPWRPAMSGEAHDAFRDPACGNAGEYSWASQQSIKLSRFTIVKGGNLFLDCNLRSTIALHY